MPAFTFSSPQAHEGFIDAPESTFASEEPFCFPLRDDSATSNDSYEPDARSEPSNASMSEFGDSNAGRRPSRRPQKPMSVDLPAFSFNPAQTASGTAPPTLSTANDSLESTRPSQANSSHRRIASAYVGANANQNLLNESDGKFGKAPQEEQSSSNLLSQPIASRKGHRHRRSAALSSQDLSAAARQTANETLRDIKSMQPSHSRPLVPLLESNTFRNALQYPAEESPRRSGTSASSSKTPSPSRVSFSERVDIIPRESIASDVSACLGGVDVRPRPRSAESALTADQKHRGSSPRRSMDDLDISRVSGQSMAMPSLAVDEFEESAIHEANPCDWKFPPTEHGTMEKSVQSDLFPQDDDEEDLQHSSGPVLRDAIELSEDFDEDPTSAIITDIPRSRSVPILTSTSCSSVGTNETESNDSVVDIDDALNIDTMSTPTSHEELRHLRGKGFSVARNSLHSSGMTSGFMGPGLHRRAESAPSSMLESTFRRPVLDRFNDASASQKGFEMSNVFEEEEDDGTPTSARHGKSSPLGISNMAAGAEEAEQRYSSSTSTVKSLAHFNVSTDKSQDCEPSNTSMISAPSTPDQNHGSRASSSYGQGNSCFGTPHTDVTSSFTDARRPSVPQFPAAFTQRCDSAPSLINSPPTLQQVSPSTMSPAFPSAPLPTDSSSSIPSTSTDRRKRSSIVSLSRLMGVATPGRSNLSISQTARCQTSDGVEAPTKEKRSKRISQKLKHWKTKVSSQM